MGESRASRISRWLYERLALDRIPLRSVPYSYVNIEMWLGAVVAASFFWLAISGLLLLIYYDPSDPAEANRRLLEERPLFKVLLTSHLVAAFAMILGAVIHMFRNFLVGAYKRPREIQWILGVVTGVFVIQTAFFGYTLIGDRIAVEAMQIGRGFVESSLGEYWGKVFSSLVFGLGEEGVYQRILGIHVIMATIVGILFLLHFGLFEAHGIMPSHSETGWKARPERLDESREDMAPWFPVNFLYVTCLTLGVWGIIFVADALLLAAGFVHQLLYPLPIFEGTEVAAQTRPMPPWFLVYAFKLFQLDFLYLPDPIRLPLGIELSGYGAITVFALSLLVPPGILIILPFIDRTISTHPLDRPLPVALVGLMLVYLIQLTLWGALTLGYYNVPSALAVFLSPALVIIPGLRLLVAYRRGEALGVKVGVFLISLGLAVTLPFTIVGLTRGQSVETAIADVSIAVLGVVLAALYLGLLVVIGQARESPGSANNPSTQGLREIPDLLLVFGAWELLVVVLAAVSINVLNPIVSSDGVTALIGVLFLAAYGLAHLMYRATTIERRPYEGHLKESLPHLLVVAGVIAAIIVLL